MPTDIYRAEGPRVAETLAEFFYTLGSKQLSPEESDNANIIHLIKRKFISLMCLKEP